MNDYILFIASWTGLVIVAFLLPGAPPVELAAKAIAAACK